MNIYIIREPHEFIFTCVAESITDCCLKMKEYSYFSEWSWLEFESHFQHLEVQVLKVDGDILDPDAW